MLVDPLAGRIDYDAVHAMTDELLMATKALAAAVRRVAVRALVIGELAVRVHPTDVELGRGRRDRSRGRDQGGLRAAR